MKKIISILFIAMLVSPPLLAQGAEPKTAALPSVAATTPVPTPAELSVQDAYALATAPMQSRGAAFVTIVNNSAVADRLIAASTPVAGMAEIHKSFLEDNTMMMVKINGVDIPAGETVMLESTGMHIMLIDLHGQLREEQVFPLKLVFEKKGEVSVDVTVRAPGETRSAIEDSKSPLP